MTVVTAEFIKKHKELIDNNDFEAIYPLLETEEFDITGDFTQTLLEAGIDPIYKFEHMPKHYLNSSNIAEYTVPSHVKSIGVGAFANCTELERVNLSEGLLTILQSAFEDSSLRYITLPSTLEEIGMFAFAGCNITQINIPDNVITLSRFAFECTPLKSIKLGNSVKLVDDRCFGECKRLESVTINDNLSTIGDYVFAECENLKSVYIPSSVTSIGRQILYKTKAIIECKEESHAHKYAITNMIPFQLV